MNLKTSADWLLANHRYLIAAVATVRVALERYIERSQNQTTETVTEGQSALQTAAVALQAPSVLDNLCSVFSLSPIERDVLLLCVGMELDPSFESLCLDAQGEQKRAYPTFSLALAIFPAFDWDALSPQSPLQRWQKSRNSRRPARSMSSAN